MVDLREKDEIEKILKQAYAISKNISNKREKVDILCDIANIMLKIDQEKEAKKLLKRALNISQNISYPFFKASAICKISEILRKISKKERAKELLLDSLDEFEQISFSIDEKASALGKVAGVLAQLGELDMALKLTDNFSNRYGKTKALAVISDELIKNDRVEEGEDKLEEALKFAEEIVFSLEKRSRALADIAKVYSNHGEMKKALEIAKDIQFGQLKKDAIIRIAKNTKDDLEPKKTEKILKECYMLAQDISKDHARATAYSQIAGAMIENGQEKKGKNILEKSLKLADSTALPHRYKKAISLCDAASTLKGKIDENRAYEVLEKALRISKDISNYQKKAETLLKISEVATKS